MARETNVPWSSRIRGTRFVRRRAAAAAARVQVCVLSTRCVSRRKNFSKKKRKEKKEDAVHALPGKKKTNDKQQNNKQLNNASGTRRRRVGVKISKRTRSRDPTLSDSAASVYDLNRRLPSKERSEGRGRSSGFARSQLE